MPVNLKLEFEDLIKRVKFTGSKFSEFTAVCERTFPSLQNTKYFLSYLDEGEPISIQDDFDMETLLGAENIGSLKIHIKKELAANPEIDNKIICLEESIRGPPEPVVEKIEKIEKPLNESADKKEIKVVVEEKDPEQKVDEESKVSEPQIERIEDSVAILQQIKEKKEEKIEEVLEKVLSKKERKAEIQSILEDKLKVLLPEMVASIESELEFKEKELAVDSNKLFAQFVKQIYSHPLRPSFKDKIIYKTIEVRNTGLVPWPSNCSIKTGNKSKTVLPQVAPGESCIVSLTLNNFECPEYLESCSFYFNNQVFGESFKLQIRNFSNVQVQDQRQKLNSEALPPPKVNQPLVSKEDMECFLIQKTQMICGVLQTNFDKTLKFLEANQGFQKEEIIERLLSNEKELNDLK